ncbi:MAG: response regulator [Lachnospiraceae bacterium]|nr:response regulator [Lachnospiraceae bacterium]
MANLVYTKSENCIGCNNCLRSCPVFGANQAQVDETGKNEVHVIAENCIHCGCCIKSCDYGARDYHDDTQDFFADLASGKQITLLVAPSFKTNFIDNYAKIFAFLKAKGVAGIFDVAFGADITTWAYLKYIDDEHRGTIAQPCPSIVNYIEMQIPALLPRLVPVQSPLMCGAIYLKKYKALVGDLAFISPCIGKKDEIDDPNTYGLVRYNVTYQKLISYMEAHGVDLNDYEEAGFDTPLSGLGTLFSNHGGLGENVRFYTGNRFWIKQIEGEVDTYEYLNLALESKSEFPPHLVDVLNCGLGCNYGSATANDYDVNEVEYFQYKLKQGKISDHAALHALYRHFDENLMPEDFVRHYTARPVEKMVATEEEIEQAMLNMSKEEPESRHINCHSCGYTSCRDMAIAIHNGLNTEKNCFYHTKKLMLDEEIARKTIEKVSETKSGFMARMSHEIRTPMNAIIGIAELALQEEVSESVTGHLNTIQQAGNDLLSIVTDVMGYSKIEQNELMIDCAAYDFVSLFHDVIHIIKTKKIDSTLRFVVNIDSRLPSTLVGDEMWIRQILLNILDNAFKFTDKGFVSMDIQGEKTADDEILLKVEINDSGRGIKEEDLEGLFANHARVDVLGSQGMEGMGLGLSISKSLALAMNGDITVKSEHEVGSRFTITILQKVESWDRIAWVEKPEFYKVLIYERRKVYRFSFMETFRNLGIMYTMVKDDTEFYHELSRGDYNYMLIPANLLVNIMPIVTRLRSEAKIMLLADPGEYHEKGKDKILLTMPIHAISVANALKGIQNKGFAVNGNKMLGTFFRAPEARILVVDDIETNLRVAEGLLLPYEMRIDLCKSGEEAINRVRRYSYDIVFMDHMMPGLSGVEATKAIRELEGERFQTMPIIALTANAVAGMREMFLQNGMDDFISKPIDIAKLKGILEKWIPTEKLMKYESSQEVLEVSKKSSHNLEIPGVDVDKGIIMIGGTVEGYTRTLRIFYQDGRDKVVALEKYLQEEEITLYTTGVHALKSALGSIGADELSRMAAKLEDAGNKKNMGFLNKENPVFLEKMICLLDNIEAIIPQKDKMQLKGDVSLYEADLIELKEAMEVLDFETMDKISTVLEFQAYAGEIAGAMENILEAMLIGDYKESIILIDALLQ